MENIDIEEKPVLQRVHGTAYMDWGIEEKSDEHKSKMELIEKNIFYFEQSCINREVSYILHPSRGLPAPELIEESRFTDVMIVGAETSFNKRYEASPTEFLRDILKRSQCPVIVAPERFDGIDEIIFTYNASSSCIFAIKQFTYLFPQLYDKKVRIIQVNETGEWHHPDKYKFEIWLKQHYTDFHFEVLKGEADSKLFEYLFNRKNMFLVMGLTEEMCYRSSLNPAMLIC